MSVTPSPAISPIQHLLEQALTLHRAGKFVDADNAYLRVLAINPRHPEALRLRGALHLTCGQRDSAIALLKLAVAAAPSSAEVHYGLGNALASSGEPAAAIGAYEMATKLRPNFGDAWCNLGNTFAALLHWEQAADAFQRAIKLSPKNATLHHNLSVALRKLNRVPEALASARRAITLDPTYVDALNNFGIACKEAGQIDEALTAYRRALALDPKCFDAHFNLGLALGAARRHVEEEAAFRAALELNPESGPAWFGLGNALQDQQRWEEASAAYQACLAKEPGRLDARRNLAGTLHKAGRFDAAIAMYREFLGQTSGSPDELLSLSASLLDAKRWSEAEPHLESFVLQHPTVAAGWVNLGVFRLSIGQYEAAEAALRHALELNPRLAAAYGNLGVVQRATGRFEDAMLCFAKAIEIDPSSEANHLNAGFGELLRGNLGAGWPLHELRLNRRPIVDDKTFAGYVRWHRNLPLAGKTICVHAEQGLGDTLQFIRYVPLLAARGATVKLAVQPPLKKLLQGFPGADTLFTEGDPMPHFDYFCPLMSLPFELETTVETIPPVVPLETRPEQVSRWSSRLMKSPARRRIGVVWSGNPQHENDHNRSIPLSLFGRLFDAIPDAHFFSLQKNPTKSDAEQLSHFANVTNIGPEFQDFTDTAAVIAGLDLVISVDTSVAHLTGSMNKPIWILLPLSPDWRWLLDRTDSPWYPSATLFRQTTMGDWATPLATVIGHLRASHAAAA